MTWLDPWSGFWVLVALVPPLVLLYVLRLRRTRLVVSSTMLWHEAAEDIQANTPFQRLRRNLLLLLQLIALSMLALAVMQPRLESAAGRGDRTVLLIDRSASMQAADVPGGGTRFEAARAQARQAVDRLHPGGWFADATGATMIVSLGEAAEIVQPFTSSRAALLDALDRIEPGAGSARLAPGVALARVHAAQLDPDAPGRSPPPARIELFSDGRLADVAEVVLQGEPFEFHRVGTGDAPNASVMSVSAPRLPDDPDQVQVFATLANWWHEPREVTVQLSIDSTAVHVEGLTLLPAEGGVPARREIVFAPLTRPGDALVEVHMLTDDALISDDTGWAVAPAPDDLRVLLVEPEGTLMARAMQVIPGLTVQMADELPASIPAGVDLVVMRSPSASALPPVPLLSLGAAVASRHVELGGDVGAQSVLTTNPRHPAGLGGFPADLWVESGRAVRADDTVDVLVEGSAGPLVIAWEEGGARRIASGFDPARSTWPWDPTFISFLMDSADWLTRRGVGGLAARHTVGDEIIQAVPAHSTQVTALTPSGHATSWPVSDRTTVTWGPVEDAGPWVLRWDGPEAGQRVLVVNLDAEGEGDLTVPESLTIAGRSVDRLEPELRGSAPLWPWALLAALLVLLIEWWVYCGRIR